MKSLKPTRLFLQPQESQAEHIRHVYQRAFDQATELYVVSAYLRTWDTELKLNADCKKFMFVVGKDFGITRKKALHTVREWLEEQERPAREFRVAHGITGFHPKAVVWKEPTGQAYMLLGSSNLSDAAFNTNYEANVFIELDALSFQDAKKWFARIADKSASRPVTADWIENEYVEAPSEGNGGGQPSKSGAGGDEFDAPTLPDFPPVEMEKLLHQRRISRAEFDQYAKRPLLKAMRACAEGRMSDTIFYDELNRIWYSGTGRIQAQGYERSAASSRFKPFCEGFLEVYNAPASLRDATVVKVIDRLKAKRIPTRKSLLSEMLCHFFPARYPLWNSKIVDWLNWSEFTPARGTTQGERYLAVARYLRAALAAEPDYPARDLAELDRLIWETVAQSEAS